MGAGASIDIYEHAASTTNPRWRWVSADSKGHFRIGVPFRNGIRVVVTLGGAEAYLILGD